MSIFARISDRFDELRMGPDDHGTAVRMVADELSDEEAEIYGRECDLILPMMIASDCTMTKDEIEKAISQAGIE